MWHLHRSDGWRTARVVAAAGIPSSVGRAASSFVAWTAVLVPPLLALRGFTPPDDGNDTPSGEPPFSTGGNFDFDSATALPLNGVDELRSADRWIPRGCRRV